MRSIFACLLLLTVAASPCQAAERVALVIGNSTYGDSHNLDNPGHDADAMEAALKGLDFQVTKCKDLDLSHLEDALLDFRHKLSKESVAFFFYAGHGFQVRGENYLVPIGAKLREEYEVKRQCLEVNQVLAALGESEAGLKVLVLDCCRDNPFKRSWSRGGGGDGLAALTDNAPGGTLIAFSTSPNKTAGDGDNSSNSPYTSLLASALKSRPAAGLELRDVFMDTSVALKKKTGQEPWTHVGAVDRYYLWRGEAGRTAAAGNSGAVEPQDEGFRPLLNGQDLTAWTVYHCQKSDWQIKDGVLSTDGAGSSGCWLMTTDEYDDFELRLEYRVFRRTNSGVAVRSPLAGNPANTGMEIQILDDDAYPNEPREHYTGSIWGVAAPAQAAAQTRGEWCPLRIVAQKRHLTVAINHVTVIDADLDNYTSKYPNHPGLLRGRIGLQTDTGRAEFRNIYVKRLGAAAEKAAPRSFGGPRGALESPQRAALAVAPFDAGQAAAHQAAYDFVRCNDD